MRSSSRRWAKAPIQMLTKCAEAAMLREAFPEEFGGEPTAEEMFGRAIDAVDIKPDGGLLAPRRKSETAAAATAVVDGEVVPEPVAATSPAAAPGVCVVDIKVGRGRRDGKEQIVWSVELSDGRIGSTFDPEMVKLAQRAKADNLGVEVVIDNGDLMEFVIPQSGETK